MSQSNPTRSQDLNQIFSASAKTTHQLLVYQGAGFNIPEYQRSYSWDAENNIIRFFEDTVQGLDVLQEQEDYIKFLGTIITLQDDTFQNRHGAVPYDQVPSPVYSIIDGQQRLSTILMTNVLLHWKINYLIDELHELTSAEDSPVNSLITDKISQLALTQLQETFQLDSVIGEGIYRYYPRIIRDERDEWSIQRELAQYESPIANFIHNYNKHLIASDYEPHRISSYNYLLHSDDYKPEYENLNGKMLDIESQIDDIIDDMSAKFDITDSVQLLSNEKVQASLWNRPLPDEINQYILSSRDDENYQLIMQLLRAVFLARFINNRIVFTWVVTFEEDYAFDMFEALNTTGEPLTAFETFKPKVIQEEKQNTDASGIEKRDSREALETIESYLDLYDKAEQRHKATSGILIPFALAETGYKLSRQLREQRTYLKTRYNPLPQDEKTNFVQHMADISIYVRKCWDINPKEGIIPTLPNGQLEDEEALFCLDVLKSLNHDITVAPLSRFYSSCLSDQKSDKPKEAFYEAVKSSTALAILWRAYKRGTKNIDAHFRSIMRGLKSRDKEIVCDAFCRRPREKNVDSTLSIDEYKKALRVILQDEGNITAMEDWVERLKEVPVYDDNQTVTRFLLFAASHYSTKDNGNPGLIKHGRKSDDTRMFNINRWRQDSTLTVEHIAPRNRREGDDSWSEDLYNRPVREGLDKLGNLILVPADINAVLSNHTREMKWRFYRALSNKDFDEMRRITEDSDHAVSEAAWQKIEDSPILPLCEAVSEYEGTWDKEFVEQRTKRLAELAWQNIESWLYDE